MSEIHSKYKFNNKIFSLYYFVEGYVQGIPSLVFPPYLAQVLGGSYDIALWLIVAFIGALPWSFKLIIGIFNDKWGSVKLGKRFPWIAGFGYFGAFWWIIMALFLPTDSTIYLFFAIYYFLSQSGAAFSDTALDGLILDVTPKGNLGKVQGFTWTCLLLGMGAGGMLLGLIFLALNIIPWLFILTAILTVISSSLPYLIEEEPFEKLDSKEMVIDLKSIISKKRNYKVFTYAFTGAIPAAVILTFFNYVILVGMGIIDVSETLLSITSGSAVDLLGWSSVFYFFNGLGTVIGSLIAGKRLDKSRKKTVQLTYLIYIPICLLSVLPFVLISGTLNAIIFGLIIQILFGAIQGALVVSNQTLRGDLTKKYYPLLKSTYFALLVALANFGQNFGTLMGSLVFSALAEFITDFYLMYFLLTVVCAFSLGISLLLFNTIKPEDYEISSITGEKEENIYFA